MAARRRVELFFDIASPYSWYGFEALARYSRVWPSMELELSPVYLGGVMKATGNKPPATAACPAKAAHFNTDLARAGRLFGVPLNVYRGNLFDRFHTITAMRLLTAVKSSGDTAALEALTRELFHMNWSLHKDPADPATLVEALNRAGLDGAESILASCGEQAVKDALKAATQRAVDKGMFGAPTMLVHPPAGSEPGGEELVFGSDRIEHVAMLLGEAYSGAVPAPPARL
mmetsp:Transcript_14263/g.48190  ORF Transcript_14263/g.48190 Transcript_14263/m.48190 type:complete len:230 (-) Transcript_14263:97-786(-)